LARAEDAASIARMSRQLVEHGLPWSWDEQRVGGCLRNRDCIVLAARDRRRLVGFAIMEFYDVHAHLSLLAVQLGHQRQGIGRQLIDWLEA
jgi:ribosomal-protein-alanine N-acetyltransferase